MIVAQSREKHPRSPTQLEKQHSPHGLCELGVQGVSIWPCCNEPVNQARLAYHLVASHLNQRCADECQDLHKKAQTNPAKKMQQQHWGASPIINPGSSSQARSKVCDVWLAEKHEIMV
jgi:hypothetical protein